MEFILSENFLQFYTLVIKSLHLSIHSTLFLATTFLFDYISEFYFGVYCFVLYFAGFSQIPMFAMGRKGENYFFRLPLRNTLCFVTCCESF